MLRAGIITIRLLSLASLLMGLTSCSSAPQTTIAGQDGSQGPALTSALEIHYILGHARYEIRMHGDGTKIVGECLLDGKSLKQAVIDSSRYGSFLSQVSTFLEHQIAVTHPVTTLPAGSPPVATRTPADCASPYTIEIKSQDETQKVAQKVEGCRVSDQGAFAHLVKTAEFIVYSRK